MSTEEQRARTAPLRFVRNDPTGWSAAPLRGSPGRDVVVIATVEPIDAVVRGLADSRPGEELLRVLTRSPAPLVVVEVGSATPEADLIAHLFAADLSSVSLLTVGFCCAELRRTNLLADHQRILVEIGDSRDEAGCSAPAWAMTARVTSLSPDDGPVGAFNVLRLPAGRKAAFPSWAAVLALSSVGRSLLTWLTGVESVTTEGGEPWLDDDLVVVNGALTVAQASDLADRLDRRWTVVPSGRGGAAVLESSELLTVAARARPDDLVGQVLLDRVQPNLPLLEAPAYLPPGEAPRAVTDSSGRVRAVVAPLTERELRWGRSRLGGTLGPDDSRATPDLPPRVQSLSLAGPQHIVVGEEDEVVATVGGPVTDWLAFPGHPVAPVEFGLGSADPLVLVLACWGSVSAVGSPHRTVPVQPAGAHQEVRFTVRAVESGAGRVALTVLQGPTTLATVPLGAIWASTRPDADPGRQQVEVGAPLSSGPGGGQLLSITPRGALAGDLLTYHFALQPARGQPVEDIGQLTLRSGELVAAMGSLYEAGLHGGGWSDLAIRCRSLFSRALPPSIREALAAAVTDGQAIHLYSGDAAQVPWELAMVDGRSPADGRFLGESLLTRDLAQGRRAGRLPELIEVREMVTVRPEYGATAGARRSRLASAAAEARHLAEHHHFDGCPALRDDVSWLLTGGRFDVFHFAGHGGVDADSQYLELDDAIGGMERLYADEIGSMRWDRRPLVFLNSCSTGSLVGGWSGLEGFARSFLEAGAGAFVSSRCRVGDTTAFRVALAFYDQLLTRGLTLAESVRSLRAVGNDPELRMAALWYAVYGHPQLRLRRAAS